MSKAKIAVFQQKYEKATEALDKLLEQNPNDREAWILRGHAFYLLDNLFDSEESYISAIRIKTQPAVTDRLLSERLGIVFARRKSWKDSKTVFLKVCKERMSTVAWFYLGLSLIRLGEFAAAEDAIAQANILNNLDPRVWALNAILCLKYGQDRIPQAKFALGEAFKLNLIDEELLEELGDMLEEQGLFKEAIEAYETCLGQNEENGTILSKLGYIYCSDKFGEANKNKSVEWFKVAIEYVEGDANRSNIALTIKNLLT